MLITIAGLLVLSWCGHAAVQFVANVLESRVDSFISWGLGFFLSNAAVIIWLSASPFAINLSSWLLFTVSAAAISVRCYRSWKMADQFVTVASTHLTLGNTALILLISVHLILILIAQSSPETFPWDAFTTWLYRAKLWVLTDQLLTLTSTAQWLALGATGYTIEAAHYPYSVSALAAFAATLGGDWHSPSASLPWLAASLASCTLMAGLCRQIAYKKSCIPAIGAALLLIAPINLVHSMLPGYADLWMVGTSGMGLASLCIWTQTRATSILVISLTLLILGPLFKQEGWLWLGVGLFSLAMVGANVRQRLVIFLFTLSVAGYFGASGSIDLWSLGVWGVRDGNLLLGNFATIGLRPVNPMMHIFDETILRNNYSLLGPFYLLALTWSLLQLDTRFSGYWLIGLLAFGSLIFTFGISSYSLYLELGTAFNRVFLHITPLLVISIVAIGSSAFELERNARLADPDSLIGLSAGITGSSIAILCVILSVLFLPTLLTGFNKNTGPHVKPLYPASALTNIGGEFSETDAGYQFTGQGHTLGVAKVPIDVTAIQPRYIKIHARSSLPGDISFYWITSLDTRVHAIPVPTTGRAILDMKNHADFWQIPIKEMGVLVPKQHFKDVVIYSLDTSATLEGANWELMHHWFTPAPLDQSTINGVDGHVVAPVNVNTVLSLALLLLVSLLATLKLIIDPGKLQPMPTLLAGIVSLWMVSVLFNTRQALAYATEATTLSTNKASQHQEFRRLDNDVKEIVGAITRALGYAQSKLQSNTDDEEKPSRNGAPVLIAGSGHLGDFFAHKLPFALLPVPAAHIEIAQLTDMPKNSRVLLVTIDSKGGSPTVPQPANRLKIEQIDVKIESSENVKLWWVERV